MDLLWNILPYIIIATGMFTKMEENGRQAENGVDNEHERLERVDI